MSIRLFSTTFLVLLLLASPSHGSATETSQTTDLEPIEVEPDLHGGAVEPVAAEGSQTTDLEPIEVEPDLTEPGSFSLDEFCPLRDGDDHGDTIFCATPFRPGEEISGDIGEAAAGGSDVDVLAFRVTDAGRVTAHVEGAEASLHDAWGAFLTRLTGSRTRPHALELGAGLYFLRIEGRSGAPGPYSVAVKALTGAW